MSGQKAVNPQSWQFARRLSCIYGEPSAAVSQSAGEKVANWQPEHRNWQLDPPRRLNLVKRAEQGRLSASILACP
jgi:hypothetical protein